jgi:hypothetical protein
MVQIYNTNMNMKTMVWGVFWDYGRSNLYIINRDFKSKKYKHSAESYLETLEAEIGLIFEDLELGYEFM